MGELEDRLHAAVLREVEPERDEARLERGTRIVGRLNHARGGAPLEVWFVSLDGNAFALPGGRVYIGRELLAGGGSDAALAFVVAHEMAHHDLGHCAFLPVLGAAEDAGDARVLAEVASKTTRTSREERAADRAALELLRRAGYPDSAAREAFEQLAPAELVVADIERRRTLGRALAPLEVTLAALAFARPRASFEPRRQALWGVLAPPAPPSLAPRGLAATSATVACAACGVRFAPHGSCPQCRRDELFDLGDPAARARLAARLGPPAYLLIPAALLIATLAMSLLHAPGVVCFLAACGTGVSWFAALARWHRVPRRLGVARALLARVAPETTVRGTVRTGRAAISPLGTACAAWHLRGRAPGGEVDDAGAGTFDVVADGGLVARVEADDALVDLAPSERVERPVEGSLAEFLIARGVAGAGRRASLAEGLLLDGDLVEVSGPADEVAVGEAYRDAFAVPLFRDWPVIRKLEQPG